MPRQRDFSDGGLGVVEEFVALLEEVPKAELEKHLTNLSVLVGEFLKYASPDLSETHRDDHAVAFVELVRRRCLARRHSRQDHPRAPAEV
jgi:hypothetical protein